MRLRVKAVLITAAIFSLTVFCCAQARAELVWRADVTAASTGDANTLILGSALDATDGFENAYELRAILSGNLMAYFYHPEWGLETPYFWSDIKDPSLPEEWPFYVSSQYTGRDIVLSWTLENVPDTLSLELVDETLGLTVDMKQVNFYRYFNATNVALRFFVRASGEIPGMGDSVPPDTAITSGPSSFIRASSVDITFTGTDDVTPSGRLSFSHNLDGGAWSGWSDLTATALSGLPNGAHTFGVKAMDEAGNEDPSPASLTFTVDVDATPPDTAITSGPSGFMATSSVDITFTGTDNVTPSGRLTFSHNLDGGAWSGWSGLTAMALSGLSNGAHTFSVKAMDEAGNEDPSPASLTFTVDVDATPPDTAITSGPSGFMATSSVDITFIGTDNVTPSGRLTFSHNLDGGAWSGWSGLTAMALSGLSNGAHTFRVKAMDEAGNEDPSPDVTSFTVDTTPPSLTVAVDPAFLWSPNRRLVDVRVTGNAVDTLSGVGSLTYEVVDEYGLFNSAGSITTDSGGEFSFTIALKARRTYTITVTAVDRAGNTTAKSTIVKTVRRRSL